ncbi:hypothetical protein BV898_06724 [Hypsibius exemplaris]|uniref:Uncharacterized protein n=1 Tax=Hypsibius exemplaris TaxID=2072580 RepID=A0A1W0WVS8_HYPEX|nr:hypothetical protein BV898_06724 [Hypsibius exemplaris]
MTKGHDMAATTESYKQELAKAQKIMNEQLQEQSGTIRDLQSLVAKQNLIIHGYDHKTRDIAVTTARDVFGTNSFAQTEDLTPGEAKVELQKLKSHLADFRRSMIAVLVGQNLIADIPSFPEQLRDTWSTNSGAAEIARDVKEHFSELTGIIANAFDKVQFNHQKAFQQVLAKKAAEIESRVQGVDSSEEMRKVRLKLRQRVLDLEVDNSQMHDTLKTLTKLLEEHRSDYEGQLVQKDEKVLKQREDTRRMKDLVWTLAENLAKLRDEAVLKMPERKSLMDIMQLLQVVEQRMNRKLRGAPEEVKKAAPQLLVHGMGLFDPTETTETPPKTTNLGEVGERKSSEIMEAHPSGSSGRRSPRKWSDADKAALTTRDKRSFPSEPRWSPSRVKGTSTADRIARLPWSTPIILSTPRMAGRLGRRLGR